MGGGVFSPIMSTLGSLAMVLSSVTLMRGGYEVSSGEVGSVKNRLLGGGIIGLAPMVASAMGGMGGW